MLVRVALVAILGTSVAFEDKTVVQWLRDNHYNTFSTLLNNTGLNATLSTGGPFTVFAPSDSVFRGLNQSMTYSLHSNMAETKRIVEYHVISRFILIPVIKEYVSSETLLRGEVIAIHKVSPTEALVNNGIRITSPHDIFCNNGVIQPIDGLLVPATRERLNIAQILVRGGNRFREFTVELLVTGLLSQLETGDYTVFALTNEAFGELGIALMDPNNPRPTPAQLVDIMKYYIVHGEHRSAMLRNSHDLITLRGYPLGFRVTGPDSTIMVNKARIIEADILASNGVIHVVDYLLSTEDYPNPSG